MPLTVVGYDRILLAGERPLLGKRSVRDELEQGWVDIRLGDVAPIQDQLYLVASPTQSGGDVELIISIVPDPDDDL